MGRRYENKENFDLYAEPSTVKSGMVSALRGINTRIRFVRWIDMDRISRPVTQAEHREIVERLQSRNEPGCLAVLEKHIDRWQDQITSAIREGIAQIYMGRETARDSV